MKEILKRSAQISTRSSKTILSVAERIHGEDDPAKMGFFMQKAEQIPASWAASYEKAKQHGDLEKMQIERIKLDTIREIREMYRKIWEGAA